MTEYNGKKIEDYSLDQLERIDWALAEKEYEHNKKLSSSPKTAKLGLEPSKGFKDLRQAVKEEMIRKRDNVS